MYWFCSKLSLPNGKKFSNEILVTLFLDIEKLLKTIFSFFAIAKRQQQQQQRLWITDCWTCFVCIWNPTNEWDDPFAHNLIQMCSQTFRKFYFCYQSKTSTQLLLFCFFFLCLFLSIFFVFCFWFIVDSVLPAGYSKCSKLLFFFFFTHHRLKTIPRQA